jgi:RNA polymerase sigma-54 factor
MKANLQLGIRQQPTLTPKLREAIRLLALSTLELNQEIQISLETNPFLEQEDPQNKEDTSPSRVDYNLIDLQSTETTLQSHLLWQMELTPFTEKERAIAIVLIDSISDEGYLTCTLDDVQDSIGNNEIALAEIESVLNRIQQFEPLGVGARTLAECLCLQLNALPVETPHHEIAKILAMHYLPLLAKKDYPKLCTTLQVSLQDLFRAIKVLNFLSPKPGNLITTPKKSEYIIPDLVVTKKNDQYRVHLNRTYTPKVRITPGFETFGTACKYRTASSSLRAHWNEAQWLIKTLETRNHILLTVANTLIQAQTEFLEYGEEKMKPLSLLNVAKELGLHESTISRVTSNKYILTPRGVFELKFFFSNAIYSSANKALLPHSASAIRALIKKWIAEENLAKPLSDQQILQRLSKEGICLARRTITKYRERMLIPSSTERRCFMLNPR